MFWHSATLLTLSLFKRTMNKTISLAAIVMVAVVMGISAIAPAAMATPSSGEPKHNPKVAICHFDFNEMQWEADKMVNKHSLKAHQAHGDKIIDDADVPAEDTISTDACLAQDDLPPKEDPVP